MLFLNMFPYKGQKQVHGPYNLLNPMVATSNENMPGTTAETVQYTQNNPPCSDYSSAD